MFNWIDSYINKTKLYQLVLICLAGVFSLALIFCFLGILPYDSAALLFSLFVILSSCLAVNAIFALTFKANSSIESVVITALILVLIITPASNTNLFSNFFPLVWAAVWAMASKYILAINKKHIFNPAAFAAALTALTINQSVSWWVSSIYLLPVVAIGGFLIVKKMRRFDLIAVFLAVALIAILVPSFFSGSNPLSALEKTLVYTPLIFFAVIMITEPRTMPQKKVPRLLFGALIGFLFSPSIHLGSFYFTPELALLAGNVFTLLVRPRAKNISAPVESLAGTPAAI
jgi:glycine betaine catabolism B